MKCKVVYIDKQTDWGGNAVVRLDLKGGKGKKADEVHIYVNPASPLAALQIGDHVHIQAHDVPQGDDSQN